MKTYLSTRLSWLLTNCIICSFANWLLISCNDLPPPIPPAPEIYYRNSQGQDLLDPRTAGYFDSLRIKWVNSDGTIGSGIPYIRQQTTISPYSPYLPNGYSFSINPYNIEITGGHYFIGHSDTCKMFIQLNKLDTDTAIFIYTGRTIKKFIYNKTIIPPPAPMTSYPFYFPAIVIK